jgi:uncharacterized membrane protein YagU involved in acid resistance
MKQHSPVTAILAGGLIAGTIDIGAACLINGRSISFILHTIAGGLLAGRAYAGGMRTALLGLLLQEAMALLIATFYVLAAASLSGLRARWLSWGLVYGVVIFVVMNYVVLPLCAWHVTPHFSAAKFVANLAAMLLFGLIVAYFGRSVRARAAR